MGLIKYFSFYFLIFLFFLGDCTIITLVGYVMFLLFVIYFYLFPFYLSISLCLSFPICSALQIFFCTSATFIEKQQNRNHKNIIPIFKKIKYSIIQKKDVLHLFVC